MAKRKKKNKKPVKKLRQTGTSAREYDLRHQAKKPGKRKAKESGGRYYEYRANRSDTGKLLGTNKPKSFIQTLKDTAKHHYKNAKKHLTTSRQLAVRKQTSMHTRELKTIIDLMQHEIDQLQYTLKEFKKLLPQAGE